MPGTPVSHIGVIDAPHSARGGSAPAGASGRLGVVPATVDEAPRIAEVIGGAFLHDPTWSWAFPDPAARRCWWQVCVQGALRYPWVLRTDGFETVAIWIPPGATELSAEVEAQLPELFTELVGTGAHQVTELLRQLGEARPHHTPHYYLSILATAPEHRGRGLGTALLRENLERIDLEGKPAYLESSNPRNNARYQSLGFIPTVSLQGPVGCPIVTGMWRRPRRGSGTMGPSPR